MKRIALPLTAAALLLAPTAGIAGPWQIDTSHTSVSFEVRHLFTPVAGKFNEVSGTIVFDPANPTAGSVEATIPVASIDTRNEKRDDHLRSPDFFDAATHPDMVFKSTKVEKTGEKTLKVTGNLTLRGVTKPVVLDVEFLGAGDHPFAPGAKVAGFAATTQINRKDFGVSWNKVLDNGGTLLSDDVKIRLDIEAIQQPDKQ